MINVTKPYLPDRNKLDEYIDRIYETAWLTNNGPLVKELTARLEKYLGVENLLLVANGTLALQIAYRVLGISGQAITTPFSFVATTSSLVWEGIEPVFADIDPETLCVDPSKIEKAITSQTTAIVPVHVFGNACFVEEIEAIALKHNLKVIYDGAHAFGVRYKGKSILSYGDATTLSFHATKLFHTIEGGAIVFKKKEDYEKAKLMIKFGIDDSDSIVEVGINAKMNEFQAAMGLCVLDEINEIIEKRKFIHQHYLSNLLTDNTFSQYIHTDTNHSYIPIILKNHTKLLEIKYLLQENGINPRRYFYPSLENLTYIKSAQYCPISQNIANRILCLPIYPDLQKEELERIILLLKENI